MNLIMILTIRDKAILLFRYVSLVVVIGLLSSIFIQLLASMSGIHGLENAVTKLNFTKFRTWGLLAISCALEEIIFRGILSLSKRAVTVSFFFWISYALYFLSKRVLLAINPDNHTICGLLVICCGVAAAISYFIHLNYIDLIRSLVLEHYSAIFWLLCLVFAAAHISNYRNRDYIFVIYLMLCIPQFLMGALFGVIRMRHGVTWSMAAHFFSDAWLLSFSLIFNMKFEPDLRFAFGMVLLFSSIYGLTQRKLAVSIIKSLAKPRQLLGRKGTEAFKFE